MSKTSSAPQPGEAADCPTPATQQPGESLAAPAEAGQGAGIVVDYDALLTRITALALSGLSTFHFEIARDRLKDIRALCELWELRS